MDKFYLLNDFCKYMVKKLKRNEYWITVFGLFLIIIFLALLILLNPSHATLLSTMIFSIEIGMILVLLIFLISNRKKFVHQNGEYEQIEDKFPELIKSITKSYSELNKFLEDMQEQIQLKQQELGIIKEEVKSLEGDKQELSETLRELRSVKPESMSFILKELDIKSAREARKDTIKQILFLLAGIIITILIEFARSMLV